MAWLAIVLGLCPSFPKSNERVWQTGTLLDANTERRFAGTYDLGGPMSPAVYHTYREYAIEGEKVVYIVEERSRSHKPRPITVNTAVKFAIEKDKLYFLDESGKEHSTRVVKRVVKSTH